MSVRKRSWKTAKGEVKEAWIVDYTDQAGQRHIETFERKKDADAKHAEVRSTQARRACCAEQEHHRREGCGGVVGGGGELGLSVPP